jgi:hypothetical protein
VLPRTDFGVTVCIVFLGVGWKRAAELSIDEEANCSRGIVKETNVQGRYVLCCREGTVDRASPSPHTARPISRELPVDRYHDHRCGFPCCLWSPMRTCRRQYPGRFNGACSLVCLHCQRPSPRNRKVGSCNYFFGTCSAFTHVTACTLAESPSDPLHRGLRQLCCLRCRLDCFRVERTSSRAGVSPAEVPAPFTAHDFDS